MKTISIFLALINSLIAGLILALSLSPAEISQVAAWWSFAKIAAAASVILVAAITWLGSAHTISAGLIHTAAMRRAALVSLCSLFLVALGAATIVWAFHLALVGSDLEFHTIVYGGSLIMQGMASLFGFAGDARNVTS